MSVRPLGVAQVRVVTGTGKLTHYPAAYKAQLACAVARSTAHRTTARADPAHLCAIRTCSRTSQCATPVRAARSIGSVGCITKPSNSLCVSCGSRRFAIGARHETNIRRVNNSDGVRTNRVVRSSERANEGLGDKLAAAQAHLSLRERQASSAERYNERAGGCRRRRDMRHNAAAVLCPTWRSHNFHGQVSETENPLQRRALQCHLLRLSLA